MEFEEIAAALSQMTLEQIEVITKLIHDLNAHDQKLNEPNKE